MTIEFIESTNSIRINCSSCDESAFVFAKEWVKDPEKYSVLPFTPKGAKLGCPKCEFRTLTINVTLQRDYAIVQCGACGFQDTFPVTPLDEKVDVYGQLIDKVREQRMHPVEPVTPELPEVQEELPSPETSPEPEESTGDSDNIFD